MQGWAVCNSLGYERFKKFLWCLVRRGRPLADDQQFKKWDMWLGKIHEDVENQLISRYIFWEVQSIIDANPRIQQPSAFYGWMGTVYAATGAAGVRRQLDLDKQSISLIRLLEEIINRPGVLSRKRFVALWLFKDPSLERSAHLWFDELVGPGKPQIDPSVVEAEVKELRNKAKILERFATKRVAHLDKNPPKRLPTYEELDACLDYMEILLKKYVMLLRAERYDLPVWVTDWKAVFRESWITPDRTWKE